MVTIQSAGSHRLGQAYRQVTDRIAQAAARAGRSPKDVVLVAVTKNASPDEIRFLVDSGHGDLGESRVQQLAPRAAMLDEFLSRRRRLSGAAPKPVSPVAPVTEVRWHMVGHLQRNKVKQVVPLVRLIHSIDTLRLAEEIHSLAVRTDRVVDVLMQVNISNEPNKSGVAAPAAIHLAEQIDTMPHLRLRGMMTMAARGADPEDARPTFARAAELFEEIASSKIGGPGWKILSMGMSDDFEVAIEEGANLVRIGRALFGDAAPERAGGSDPPPP